MPAVANFLQYGLVLFLAIRGLIRGASGEIGGLLGLVVAVTVGYYGSAPLRALLLAWQPVAPETLRFQIMAFLVVTGITVASWLLVGRWLKSSLRAAMRQPFDMLVGAALGGAKGLLIIWFVQQALKMP